MSTVEAHISDFTNGRVDRAIRRKAFVDVTKPRLSTLVVFSATTGYLLGLPTMAEIFSSLAGFTHFALTVIGITLVAMGSCALNNFIEHRYDSQMNRTKNRAIPSGVLLPAEVLILGLVLSFVGMMALMFISLTVVALAALTLITYTAIYTPLKRKSTIATLIGAVPGALPPLGGWVAATGVFEPAGFVLFMILFFWQMPHFLALSWMYREDYARGGFVMLSVIDKTGATLARQVIMYTVALALTAPLLTIIGVTGWIYGIGSLALGVWFVSRTLPPLKGIDNANAKKVLLSSYSYLMGVLVLMLIDKVN